jgi:hypothetical protein
MEVNDTAYAAIMMPLVILLIDQICLILDGH